MLRSGPTTKLCVFFDWSVLKLWRHHFIIVCLFLSTQQVIFHKWSQAREWEFLFSWLHYYSTQRLHKEWSVRGLRFTNIITYMVIRLSRHKLKHSLKTQKMYFLPVILTTFTQVYTRPNFFLLGNYLVLSIKDDATLLGWSFLWRRWSQRPARNR